MTTKNSEEQGQTYPVPPNAETGNTGEWIAFAGELVTEAARRVTESPNDPIEGVVDSWIERYGVAAVASAFQALTPDALKELALIVAKRGVASLKGRVTEAEDLLAGIEG